MSNFTITSHKDNSLLFQGNFNSFPDCLEEAITQNTDLRHADLHSKNLSNSNLDDAKLHGADFTGSNLSGTNLSESDLSQCNFSNATLFNTCLAYSNLQDSQFEGAQFGATDITGANLSCCIFSGLSCFTLNFIEAREMEGCSYKDTNKGILPMNKPPIVIMGLHSTPIACLDDTIKLGEFTRRQ